MMFGIVDLAIAVLLLAAVVAGFGAGLFSILGALCGLVAGALAVPFVLPLIARALPESEWQGLIIVAAAVVLLAVGMGIGSAIGALLRRGADKLRLKFLERMLGGVAALVAGALAITMAGSAIASAGIPGLSPVVASSTVLRTIEQYTPAPLAEGAARLRALVFGSVPLPTVQGPDSPAAPPPDPNGIDLSTPGLKAAQASVAKISGVASQCSIISTGSGFVVAPDRIMTNAHVVAGVTSPVVELPGEPARDGRVVYFDPVDDIAVVAADVTAKPLGLSDALAPGAGGAVMGYPFGGPFRVVPAGVLSSSTASIQSIDGSSSDERSIYALQAQVEPGNSGGPLLTQDGQVAGMVFAKDEVKQNIGYAMTNAELLPVIAQAENATKGVATGSCRR